MKMATKIWQRFKKEEECKDKDGSEDRDKIMQMLQSRKNH